MIVLNLKTYEQTLKNVLLLSDITSDIVSDTGIRIVICPPAPFLASCAERFSSVFAQHCDPEPPGPYTGSIPAELLKILGVKGSILNHSERRLPRDKLNIVMDRLHSNGLETLICAATTSEMSALAHWTPTYLAVEPPELINNGISVSKAKPEIVLNSVKAVKEVNHRITVLCGAGVTNKEDVKKALELGSEGVLLSSAFVKSNDPKAFLEELTSVF